MRTVLLAVAAMLFSSPCSAIIDAVADWQALEVQAIVDGVPVVIVARADDQSLVHLALRVRGRTSVVPITELSGVPKVLLRTLRVVSPDVKSHKGPNVRVEFELTPLRAVEQRGSAEFFFEGGAYIGRLVEREVDGKLVVRESKEVNQPTRPAPR